METINAKPCKQCGEIKPIEQFRKYYGGRKGTYTMCKACERINSRAKYLERKGDAKSDTECEELSKIYRLYEALQTHGLSTPKSVMGKQVPAVDIIEDLLEKYSTPTGDGVPIELASWLDKPLTEEPEYYLDEVYEDLKKQYRPVVLIEPDTLIPLYDDRYKTILDKILVRFNNYEDEYYSKGD